MRLAPNRIEDNFGTYYWETITGNILSKLQTFWFLPVIFLVFLVNYPVIRFAVRRIKEKEFDK